MDLRQLKETHPDHFSMAAALRFLAADAVHHAASGHQGMPIGMADVATVLYRNHLRFDPKAPNWADRDRFILSAGHGSMLLYGLLHLTGYPQMDQAALKNFRQLGAPTAGHPEYGHADGIETTTGPLGQGIATSVGFAMAEEALAARFGRKIVDHYTYVIAGDGCLMEGVSHEAIGLAGHQALGRLIVFWDDNDISIDGRISLSDATDQRARFAAAGWHVVSVDGHDPDAIDAAILEAKADPRPSLIACKTTIALGVTGVEDTNKGHGYAIKDAQLAQMREAYGWPHAAFEVPRDVQALWQTAAARGVEAHHAWAARFEAMGAKKKAEFLRVMAGDAPRLLSSALKKHKKMLSETAPSVATRKASEMALEVINPIMPETIGGSADLTGSNNTLTKDLGAYNAGNRAGRHVYWGIREHGMAAAMNGMALHGGIRPYGGTFMCFTDYARPAMRLSALMGVPTTYVMTHDSIGLGEDGPTHQPVEHLAMLRATPNTLVIRPADAVETAEAWEIALTQQSTPTVLSLTRQNLPTLRKSYQAKNMTALGGYILAEAENKRRGIIIATGSEVEIAMEARARLEAEGIGVRVVSMPSFELFATQEESYRKRVLPAGPVRVGVEAALRQGWDRWLLGERGSEKKAAFVGMEGFGASAPAEVLYAHFGITADAVAQKLRDLL